MRVGFTISRCFFAQGISNDCLEPSTATSTLWDTIIGSPPFYTSVKGRDRALSNQKAKAMPKGAQGAKTIYPFEIKTNCFIFPLPTPGAGIRVLSARFTACKERTTSASPQTACVPSPFTGAERRQTNREFLFCPFSPGRH